MVQCLVEDEDEANSNGRTISAMKTMTCRQMGGPCDAGMTGEKADEVIKAQDRHLKESVKAGDSAHQEAHQQMKGRWRHPKASMGWYRDVKNAFSALPQI